MSFFVLASLAGVLANASWVCFCLIKCVYAAKSELGSILGWRSFLIWSKECLQIFINDAKNKDEVFHSQLYASICSVLSSAFFGIACYVSTIPTERLYETVAQASGIIFCFSNAFSFLALGAMLACHPFEDVFENMRRQIKRGTPTSLLKAQAFGLACTLAKTTRSTGISSNSTKRL